ncbi:MAG: dephospho-CoA kinase [Pseudomonadota bacterium]
MIVLGLTGSIGMGKSTTAQMFRDIGIPVHDADAVVHNLYAGRAAPMVEARFPGTVENGVVNRETLKAHVVGNDAAMKALETIVHPLVAQERDQFLEEARAKEAPFVIMDVPLLFETGGDARVDGVIVVTAPADVQRDRVLARPGMTEDQFEAILARQVPDADKRNRADFIIDTSLGMEAAREAVNEIATTIRDGGWKKADTIRG